MSKFDERLEEELAKLEKQKKKKKQQESSKGVKGTSIGSKLSRFSYLPSSNDDEEEDIAPVKTVSDGLVPIGSKFDAPHFMSHSQWDEEKKEKEEGRTWFQKGAFSDGYDFGDVTRTILGTATDVVQEGLEGILEMGESAIDTGAYLLGGTGSILGGDAIKRKTSEFIQKDLIDSEGIVKRGANNAIIPALLGLLGTEADEASVLGERSEGLVNSGGQLAAQIALQSVGIPWVATSGVSSFGSEVDNALNQGATYDQAGWSAAISAGAEILTEKLFGGSGLGEKGLINLEPLTKAISNKAFKALADYGVDMAAEGAEEVFSQFISNLGSALYREEDLKDILFSEEAIDGYIESAIGGAALGGFANVRNAVDSVKSGKDYRTGLDANEEAVVKKETENRIAELKEAGEKITSKLKSSVEQQVIRDLEKGYISTDTIEEVLGGDTYKSYKDTVDSENALFSEADSLQEEFDTLNRMKREEMTPEQVKREAELESLLSETRTRVEDTRANSQRNQLKERLGSEVMTLAQNNRLIESYNERTRRTQAFEADLSKYDEKQQAVIRKAAESGILNNTNRTHEFVDMVAKISADKGVLFDFTNNAKLKESGFAVDGKVVNGYVTKDGITINVQSAKSLNSLVGHEITHVLEGTDLYKELQGAVLEYAMSKNDYTDRYNTLAEMYKNIEGANVYEELTADLVGDYLFTDQDFINNLSTNHRNVFQKIYDEVKYLLRVVTAGSKEARQLEKVKRAFEKAYQAESNTKAEVKTEGETMIDPENDSDLDYESPMKYSVSVTDPDTIDFLENQEHITTYKAMVLIDGKLYPPMASKVKGEDGKYRMTNPRELGEWQQATEDTTNIKFNDKGIGYYDLKKDDGGTVRAAYNPYEHSSNLVLNDQFEAAYKRDNLVTVECEIPVSEMSSGYRAEHAKDSVGMMDWHSGVVAGKLKDNKRMVYLSRYLKAVRILSDAETAVKFKEIVGDTPVPFNVVSPGLLAELEKIGVNIDYDGSPQYQYLQRKAAEREAKKAEKAKYSLSDSTGRQLSKEQQEYFKDSAIRDKDGNLMVLYHGTQNAFTVFDIGRSGENYDGWSEYGEGIYLTPEKKTAQYYGDNAGRGREVKLMEVYADIKNPFSTNDPVDFDISDLTKKYELTEFDERFMKKYGSRLIEFLNHHNESVRDYLTGKGFDGVWETIDGDVYQVIAYAENQVKNTDNTKPTENPDIRYSLSEDSDGNRLTEEQERYFRSSKMRDESGNLKVMYHGSQNGGFHTFDPGYSDDGASFFFVDRNTVASSYSGTSETYAARSFKTADDFNKFFAEIGAEEYEVQKKDGKFILYEDGDIAAESDTADGIYEEFRDWSGLGYGNVNYKVYLDLVNPFIFDAKGAEWNGLPNIQGEDAKYEYIKLLSYNPDNNTYTIEYAMTGDPAPQTKDAVPFADLDDGLSTQLENLGLGEELRDVPVKPNTTRDYAEYARKNGYDGVILKNIVDVGGYGGDYAPATVAIAFDGSQVKSVANQNPTTNKDIRYSLSEDSNGRKLSAEQSEYFKDSVVRDANGKLMPMYHGTPNAGFTEFKSGTYFTEHKWYADRYQSQGASSLGYKKTANNPDTYAVYLNIKKPFDTRNPRERKIFENEYYGQWGMGTPLMESGLPDWMDGEDLQEFIEENGYDYDGLILDEGAVGGYGDEVASRGISYVVFSPEQVKNIDNQNPTFDPDIRFSLSNPVEETKDLMALHNLTEQKLLKSLKLGGLPMPSVAIAKAKDGHGEFGEISLILPKETIDPKSSSRNKLYSSDAWTPTYPKVDYKPSEKVLQKVKNRISRLVPYEVQDVLGNLMFDTDNASNYLDRYNGNMVEAYKNDDAMKYAYLKDTGSDISLPMKEKDLIPYGTNSNSAVRYFSGKLVNGLQTVEQYQNMNARDMLQDRALTEAVADAQNFDVLRTLEPGSAEYLEYERNPVFHAEEVGFRDIDNFLSAARKLFQNGLQQTVDRKAAKELIRETVDQAAYEGWLENLFSGIVEKEGIRNEKDLFTPSGNRRSFEALHYENNLENVVKAMREKGEKGIGGFGGGNIFGASAIEFSSVDDMKQASGRLQKMSEEEYQEIKKGFSDRFFELASSLPKNKNSFVATDDAANVMTEAVMKYQTKRGIANYLRRELDGWANYSPHVVDGLIELVNDIRNMPTGYFEAKPQRAISFDEVGVFVIPYDADVKLKQELLNRGYNIAEYDPNVEGDRTRVLNNFEEYMFSLSNVGKQQGTFGKYNVYGSDIALPSALEEIGPTAQENRVVETVSERDIIGTPATEEEVYAYGMEMLDHTSDADAPPEMDAPYFEDSQAEVEDPFEDRDWFEVSKDRKTPAYMYENPEVKPFFQDEAQKLLDEFNSTIRGERFWTEEGGYSGVSRMTSKSMETLLDDWKMRYDDIEKGLKAIIEDNGAENIAAAKKIEFMLNDRLLNGYEDFWTGQQMPPSQEYINALEEKQITEYHQEAFERLMADPERFSLYQEIPETEVIEDIAPVKEQAAEKEYEAIKPQRPPRKKTENKLVRVDSATPEDRQIARVLDSEPTPEKRKSRAWARFKANVLDKGAVFEDLALKKKNRELMGKWNYILSSEARAQHLMGTGNDAVKSLNAIREEVENTGKTKQFYEYLYHRHNADRMTLADRYEDMENKPVFGYDVTAAVSRSAVAQIEASNPAFKQYAQDVYAYMNYLRKIMVDNGVISKETASLWAKMYPHYVPIRRLGDTGLNINVPLDTGRTGVNAPIKRATGGSRDILPLFDTMALRTLQTYKAISKNNFGVELKNTLGTAIGQNATNIDEVLADIDAQEGLLQEGKNGRKPTFTVFENGEKVTFEITEDMYDALKPTSEGMAYTNKALNTISNLRRGVLTEYNPVFMLTNAIKDTQDILINSQHPARTYLKIAEAHKQLLTKGYWYKEYMANGGEQNTYFEKESNTFDTKAKGMSKLLEMPPFSTISKVNNYIEMIPRLAEYIASREAGRSAEVSMLDAARVTTNFAAGGDLTKLLNRNGATFLNASVQGLMQNVRNVREAKAAGLKGWANLATKFAIAGLPAVLLNTLLWEDDEEYEELSDYVKQSYYVVWKTEDGKFIRIPKGRTLAVIQNGFEQMNNLITGDDEADLSTFLELMVSNLAPNNPIEENILSPIFQVANNETWYGEDLVPTRLQNLPAAEQYDESTDSFSKWLGEKLNVSPVKINYLLDQYSGGLGDTFLPMMTPEAESGDNSFMGNMLAPLKSKFTTDPVMNNQNVADFYELKDELTVKGNSKNATDEDILKAKYINSVNTELSELYAQKREIQNSGLPDDMKYEQVYNVQQQIVELTRNALNTYNGVSISGEYATVGDRYFKVDENGEWGKLNENQVTKYEATSDAGDSPYATDGTNHYRWYVPEGETEGEWKKITEEQLEKQNEVTKGLGISAEEYWGKKEEYDYAYEHPERYLIAKAVGGYDTYKAYSDELYDIKADKDANGKSINGSRKAKVLDYINNMDADYGTKIILFKNEYNADDTYNYDIIDYLNSREDISYSEMETILKKLGFEVSSDGTITW